MEIKTISCPRLKQAVEEVDTAQQAHATEVEENKKEFEACLEKQKLQLEIQVAEAKVCYKL